MNIHSNQLTNVTTDTCLLDMDYDLFIALLDISMELLLCSTF